MNAREAARALGVEYHLIVRWAHNYLEVPNNHTERSAGLDLDDFDLRALRVIRDIRALTEPEPGPFGKATVGPRFGNVVRRALHATGEGRWIVLTGSGAYRLPLANAVGLLGSGQGCIVVRAP